jgi:hypothetical protein
MSIANWVPSFFVKVKTRAGVGNKATAPFARVYQPMRELLLYPPLRAHRRASLVTIAAPQFR